MLENEVLSHFETHFGTQMQVKTNNYFQILLDSSLAGVSQAYQYI